MRGSTWPVTIGEVASLSLIKRGLGTVRRIAVAAPDYPRRRGWPLRPDDLAGHDCIVRRVTSGDGEWRLSGPDGTIGVAVRGAVITNNHEGVRGAALSGLGIALLPEYLVVDDIKAGRLERVLPEYSSESSPAYVVYPSRLHLAPRTRVVIDFLIEEVQRIRFAENRSITLHYRYRYRSRPVRTSFRSRRELVERNTAEFQMNTGWRLR